MDWLIICENISHVPLFVESLEQYVQYCFVLCCVTLYCTVLYCTADGQEGEKFCLLSVAAVLQDVNVAADEVEEAEDDLAGSEEDFDDVDQAAADLGGGAAAAPSSASAAAAAGGGGGGTMGPAVQLLVSSCWTSVKEVSLLVATLARCLPLPSSKHTNTGQRQQQQLQPQGEPRGPPGRDSGGLSVAAAPSAPSGGCGAALAAVTAGSDILQVAQLTDMGDLLLSLLLSMKHNGAVEKSQAGFLGLAARLLQSSDPGLNGLPGRWLQRCLARVTEKGQCRDDIVRRSAGEARLAV
jgi:hypothetical protein